ncbi:MAG TPA: HAMP domain-containing sensor histidine kinase [Pseudonocardiaceae bacterium]|nr:HAMP domain-containing sensor histidine kinase [Pseudonocardiaceae bacterium]
MHRWSLRARLLAGQLLVLALVCLVIGVGTLLSLNNSQMSQLDAQLSAANQRAANPDQGGFGGLPGGGGHQQPPRPYVCGTNSYPTGEPIFGLGQGIGTLTGGVLNNGVVQGPWELVDMSGRNQQHDVCAKLLPAADAAIIGALQPGHPVSRSLPDIGDYRLLASSTPDGMVVTGISERNGESTLWTLGWALGVVALIGLALAGLLGWAIVRRTLRPLRRVADTAVKVTELTLDRGDVALSVRVPDMDTDPSTEVGQVGAALNRMLHHVDGALAARQASETRARQFVADASHELRTPLAAIRGYAELTQRSRDTVPPELAHAMRRVHSESARMSTLVDDLLLLARLDSGRPLDLREMDLTRLIVDVISDAHVAGPGHVWRLELPEEPVTIVGDAARLHQVLANLVTNARTHTPGGSTVTTALARGPGDTVVVTVTDNGPGIPPDVLPNIFERFARGDTSRSRAAGSTGLGLAIVAAVVAAHHGTVEVASVPGHTVFTVKLPCNTR